MENDKEEEISCLLMKIPQFEEFVQQLNEKKDEGSESEDLEMYERQRFVGFCFSKDHFGPVCAGGLDMHLDCGDHFLDADDEDLRTNLIKFCYQKILRVSLNENLADAQLEDLEDLSEDEEFQKYSQIITSVSKELEDIQNDKHQATILRDIAEGIGSFDHLCPFHDSVEFDEENPVLCSTDPLKTDAEKKTLPDESDSYLCLVTGDTILTEDALNDHIEENASLNVSLDKVTKSYSKAKKEL